MGCVHRFARNLAWPNVIHPQRASYVLDPLLPCVLKREIELVAHLVAYDPIDADPARLGQSFESRCDIDTIAIDVAAVLDDVAEIDPDTELDALLLRHPDVAFSHLLLNLDGATHRIDNAGELDQQPVASRLNNAAAVLLDLWVGKLASQLLQRSESAFFVRSHQTRISSELGRQDRCEPPLDPCLCHRSRPRSRATAYYPWATAKA